MNQADLILLAFLFVLIFFGKPLYELLKFLLSFILVLLTLPLAILLTGLVCFTDYYFPQFLSTESEAAALEPERPGGFDL